MLLRFTDEQARVLINLRQRYEGWLEAERAVSVLPYGMARKEIGGRSYLYELHDRKGNGRSLGPWSDEQARRLAAYQETKAGAQARVAESRVALEETARLARALRVPAIANDAGPILREADRRDLLGRTVLVVGTNTMAAYSLEAGGFVRDLPDETQDFDLAWTDKQGHEGEQVLWDMLKAVDPTFTVNTERTFQARNAKAYEVEVLVAPSRAGTMARTDRPRPVPLPEQEWLLEGRFVDQVVICRDGSPARIVAPDPRWLALHKLWLSEQPKRSALKRPKDRKQALLLLDTIVAEMPHYPLDDAFEAQLPGELAPLFVAWQAQSSAKPSVSW